jgi:hypothetical protein
LLVCLGLARFVTEPIRQESEQLAAAEAVESTTWNKELSNNPGRLTGMKLALWLVLLPVIVAGCFGGGHAVSGDSTGNALPTTSLRISYQVGGIVAHRSHLVSCPTGATCRDIHLPRVCESVAAYCQHRPWVRVAVRQLTCSPSGGDYTEPKAACMALDDLERRVKTSPATVCECPPEQDGHQSAKAKGRYQGHRFRLALDFCSLCGLGTQAAQDIAVLIPQ